MKIPHALKAVLGFAILAVLIYRVGISKLFAALGSADWHLLLIIVPLFCIAIAMRAANLAILLRQHPNTHVSAGQLVRITAVSWAAGMFTPGKVGELSAIYLLKKAGLPGAKSTALNVINKVVISLTIGAWAVLGLVLLLGFPRMATNLGMLLAAAAVPFLIITTTAGRKLLRSIAARMFKPAARHIAAFSDELSRYMHEGKAELLSVAGMTTLWMALSTVLFWLAFLAVDAEVSIAHIFFINAIGSVTAFAPFTIGGTGVRELAAVGLFALVNVPATAVLSSHLIIAAVSYGLASLVMAGTLLRKEHSAA